MKVTIIDYGLSNLLSVQHAFAHFGAETLLTSKPEDVLGAPKTERLKAFLASML